MSLKEVSKSTAIYCFKEQNKKEGVFCLRIVWHHFANGALVIITWQYLN